MATGYPFSARDGEHSDRDDPLKGNRWCQRYAYFVDIMACMARAKKKKPCRRCLTQWRQLPLPFPEHI